MIVLCLVSAFGLNVTNVHAKENSTYLTDELIKSSNGNSSRGATDIYYEVINYTISNKKNRKFLRTIEISSGFSLSYAWQNFTIEYQRVVTGTYKQYSYTADFYLYTRKVDAMGHFLGNQTFSNKGVEFHEYIAV